MTRREPEWDDESRATVLSLLDYESQRCSCGGFLPETTDPKNEGRYVTDPPRRCFRCDAVQIRQAQYQDTTRPSALTMWPVRLSDFG